MPHLHANLVDIPDRRIRAVRLQHDDGVITAIDEASSEAAGDRFLLPGFVDAHVHVESSMLTPAMFAAAAVTHGTVATVSDPHEIANVLGVAGVEYMLRDAARVPMKIFFGAPSCVPATVHETSGGLIDVGQTEQLLQRSDIHYLAEMMNFPGVLNRDEAVMNKLAAAKKVGKPIDGHAPALRGQSAHQYFAAGISTDHECVELDEAIEKIEAGALIQIREGSAAKNFDALWTLIDRYPGKIMLCSDDKHPDDLVHGHINELCRRALERGVDLFHLLTAACITPVQHYGLSVGQCRVGDAADFIEVRSLETFDVLRTTIGGICVAESGEANWGVPPAESVNHFECSPKIPADFRIEANAGSNLRVIVVEDRQLVTRSEQHLPYVQDGHVVSDVGSDVLKLTVVNRYQDHPPAVAFVRSFGLQRGAIAGSVAHDSHNILAVGVHDEDLCAAVNAVIQMRGGLAVVDGNAVETLPLPVAGLMSTGTCKEVASDYERLGRMAKELGCELEAPFMTLSFLALLVIPELKLSDLGLFDGNRFEPVSLFC